MVIKSNKTLKHYRVVLAPEFVRFAAEGQSPESAVDILRTFDTDILYISGTDSYIAAGTDFDYLCIRAEDGSTCFTVPAYKVRYCTERQPKKRAKVFLRSADKVLSAVQETKVTQE